MKNQWYRSAVLAMFFTISACSSEAPDANDTAEAEAAEMSQSYAIYSDTPQQIILGSETSSSQVSVSSQPPNGTLTGQLSGKYLVLTYLPNAGFTGNDSFTFSVVHEDGGVADGNIDITVLSKINGLLDSDDDGITDLDETDFYGTSPLLADTDADGFSDFDEVLTYGFDATVNNFRFNPLIADVPQIDIELVSAPDIFLNYTETNGTASSVSTSRSESSSSTITKSETREESTSFEHSHSFGIEVGVEKGVEASLGDGLKASTTYHMNLSYDATMAWGESESNAWTNEQSEENSSAVENAEAFEESHSIDTSGGGMFVNVRVKNTGDISYSLKNLYLNASYLNLSKTNPTTPIGNLVFENQFVSEFPTFTLAPGEVSGVLTYTTAELSIQTTKNLLTDSQGMSIRPAIFDLLDKEGLSYSFNQTGIKAQDATVIVDFGGVNTQANLTKLVATNPDPQNTGVSVASVLEDILQLAITVDANDGFLDSVDGIANSEPQGYWVMLHAAQTGNDKIVTTVYTTPNDETRVQTINSGVSNLVSSYDIENIRVRGGDVLHLVYMLDDDQDGISNRDEFLYRTDINNPDTDGDGLTDYTEVTGWQVKYTEITGSPVTIEVKSDPLLADTDSDGLSDYDEANIATADTSLKRNPRSDDTDGDGIPDSTDDIETGNVYLANIFDRVDLVAFSSAVVTPATFPSNIDFSYQALDVTEQGAGVAGNGIDEYQVHIYRHIATDGVHPEPLAPPLDYAPIVVAGQVLSCGAGCDWKLVHISADIPGAISPALSEDGTGVTDQINAGEDFKYIAYLRINGRYYRSSYSTIAAATTETVTIHMLGGTLDGVKTVADTRTQIAKAGIVRYSAEYDEVFYERGTTYGEYLLKDIYGNEFSYYGARAYGDLYDGKTGGWKANNVYYDRCPVANDFESNFQYILTNRCWKLMKTEASGDEGNEGYVTDDIAANDLPPYTHPSGLGDSRFTLDWQLFFDGNAIANRPAFPDGAREICGGSQWRERDNKLPGYIDGLDTLYLNSYVRPGPDCENVDAFADDGDGGVTGTATGYTLDVLSGGAVFNKTLPAQAGCYRIRLKTYELEKYHGVYNKVDKPVNGEADHANVDESELCRDADGIWSIQPVQLRNDHADQGVVISPVTIADSPNRLQYRTRTMSWKDKPGVVRTTTEGDLRVRYDISVVGN